MLLEPAPDWMVLAACAGMPTSLWFPERGQRPEVALKTCAGCVVQDECLAFGLGERFGIWGGTGERRRKKLRRRRVLEPIALRSHDESVIAPEALNGDVPSPAPAQEVTEPAGVDDHPTPSPARTCRGCGASLEGRPPSTVWHSQECRNRNRERDRNGKSSAAAELLPAPPTPFGLFDLAGMLAASIPEHVTFTVELAGVTVTAARA
jgi:hypothetical protein